MMENNGRNLRRPSSPVPGQHGPHKREDLAFHRAQNPGLKLTLSDGWIRTCVGPARNGYAPFPPPPLAEVRPASDVRPSPYVRSFPDLRSEPDVSPKPDPELVEEYKAVQETRHRLEQEKEDLQARNKTERSAGRLDSGAKIQELTDEIHKLLQR